MASDSSPHNRDEELIGGVQRQYDALRTALPPRLHADPMAQIDVRGSSHDAGRLTLQPDSFLGYELLQECHRGGQGIVYEALQRATRRKVAIKVLYERADDGSPRRRRFEREIEILSQLHHPNIVTVHDSGESAGRFFYVMDLVHGKRLDHWLTSRRKGVEAASSQSRAPARDFIRETLRLFVKICDAVNAAHLRGVIHRDLKPGNILIDGAGEPHLLDFGLAKFTLGMPDDPSELPTMTHTGEFVGSLPWSSPEQASGTPDQIDTRTDVYALGVLLYHALAEQFPYPITGGVADVVEQIRHAEPAPLDRHRFDGDVITIVEKCLQKDRERRYQTAGDIARDIDRCLSGEPIEARRDSMAYMLRKRLRRHWLPVSAAAAVIVACMVGLVVSLIFWRQAEQERIVAQQDRDRAIAAEQAAERERAIAQHERDRALTAEQLADQRRSDAEAVAQLMGRMFGLAKIGKSAHFIGRDTTVKDVLDEYSDSVVDNLADQPRVEIALRGAVCAGYYNLGEFARAEGHATRWLELSRAHFGENSREASLALNYYGMIKQSLGQLDAAQAAFDQVIAADFDPPPDGISVASEAMFNLATLIEARGDYAAAETKFRELIDRCRGDPDEVLVVGRSLRHLGWLIAQRGDYRTAEATLLEAIAILKERETEDRAAAASAYSDLGTVLMQSGRPAEAAPYIEDALALYLKLYGEKSPRAATTMSNLGLVLMKLGKLDDAEAHLRQALAIRKEVFPDDHTDVAQSLNNLGRLFERRKDFAGAAEHYSEALRRLVATLPESHPNALIVRNNLARALQQQGLTNEAAAELEKILALQRERLSPESPEIASTLAFLGSVRSELGLFAEAESVLREALTIRENALPADHWLLADARGLLGQAILGQDRAAEAEPLLLESYESLQANSQTPPARLREAIVRVISLYERQSDAANAAAWKARLDAAPQ